MDGINANAALIIRYLYTDTPLPINFAPAIINCIK